MDQEINIIDELKNINKKLKTYQRYIANTEKLTEAQERYRDRLKEELTRRVSSQKELIIELTQMQFASRFGHTFDVWREAFNTTAFSDDYTSLTFCIQAINEAIGKLESEMTVGKRTQSGQRVSQNDNTVTTSTGVPKAFIAHGGISGVLHKLQEFLRALEIDPLVVELLPSKGMTVDDKVNEYIQHADFGIVLATKGKILDETTKKIHPRLNVIDEYERLRAKFPDKTILLVEKGVTLPSNISGIAYEPFVRQSMDRAFIGIARELTEFGILKAIKPF
jgi:predicted nucleotide-binding protein